jgi:hypothetical protein
MMLSVHVQVAYGAKCYEVFWAVVVWVIVAVVYLE